MTEQDLTDDLPQATLVSGLGTLLSGNYIGPETRFWDASGIDLSLGADGLQFYPDRLTARLSPEQAQLLGSMAQDDPADRIEVLRHQVVDLGMRARIASGNLLTGQHYVAFAYDPTAPKVAIDWNQEPLELPVLPGGLSAIEDQVTEALAQLDAILKKIDQMPLGDIGHGVDRAMKSLDRVLKGVDAKTLPELTRTLARLDGTLAAAERVLKNTDQTLLGPDAPAQQELRDALQEIARTARSLRTLTDYLERHPEALIRGKANDNQ